MLCAQILAYLVGIGLQSLKWACGVYGAGLAAALFVSATRL